MLPQTPFIIPSIYLIEYAVAEARQALDYANKLDEKKYWGLQLEAKNNYLMALAERGDPGDTNETYRIGINLERELNKHQRELEPAVYDARKETIYFARCRLPRANSDDSKIALKEFKSLKNCPGYKKWQKRWKEFNLI